MEKEPITINGLEKLKAELKDLKEAKRPKIVSAIAEARSHGDLKENAEYHAAKEQQSLNEGRIQVVEDTIARANVIDVTKIENIGKVILEKWLTIPKAMPILLSKVCGGGLLKCNKLRKMKLKMKSL